MLSISGAHRLIKSHLGDTPRASHSIFVGRLMRRLADATGADPELWEVTGLCHDLDFDVVDGDWSQHGLIAARWLEGDLPAEALDAIRSHDHRTGVASRTSIAHALKVADALAISYDQLGHDLAPTLAAGVGELGERLSSRPYLAAMIVADSAAIGLSLGALSAVVRSVSEGSHPQP